MSKPKIFAYGQEIVNKAPRVKGIHPTGSQLLVELLSAQEALGTNLSIGEASDVGAPQAYVLAFGPGVKSDDWGVKVGDRVLLQGTYVPVPKFGDQKRRQGLCEIHNVKAVLDEEVIEEN